MPADLTFYHNYLLSKKYTPTPSGETKKMKSDIMIDGSQGCRVQMPLKACAHPI